MHGNTPMPWEISFAKLPHPAAAVGKVDRIHATVAARDESCTVDIVTSYPTLRPRMAAEQADVTASAD
ncbi:hypothetical protein C8J98_103371 [Luteibacter sp. OK325]|nr:hypothetical protein C8J98_103371 [Luteibacter sp. OK325]